MLGGYPFAGRADKNVFNRRAAQQLARFATVSVVNIRMWRPGRLLREDQRDGDVRVHHLCLPQLPHAHGGALVMNLRLVAGLMRRLLRDEIARANVFHSVGASFSGLIGGWLSVRFGRPHIAQLIGSDINSEFPSLMSLHAIRTFNDRVSAVGCNSAALQRAYQALFPAARHVEVIYRGLPLGEFPDPGPVSVGPTRFLFLGGLPDYPNLPGRRNTKGGITLMAAWKACERELAECGAVLAFGGPSSDCTLFHRWRAGLSFPDRVELLGQLTPAQVRQAMKEARVVVVPSLEEGLPNVAMEAGASARAVIGATVGGLPEVVHHERTGWLVPAADASALGSAMLQAARDLPAVARLGTAARQRIETYFNAQTFAPQYVALYQRVLAAGGA